MPRGLRIFVIAVIMLVTLMGVIVYLGQAVQPARETTVDIIPNETFK